LHLIAKYYDIDRYRSDPLFIQKMGVPEMVSWDDSKAQRTIIRWVAKPGGDDIDDPGHGIAEPEAVPPHGIEYEREFDFDGERLKPYEETEDGKEEALVQRIMGEWLQEKFGVVGDIVFCAECDKFMSLRCENGR
jgi:hypothetical protein